MSSQGFFRKYPSTRHLRGSQLQPGDDAGTQVDFAAIRGVPLTVEEKVDGANAGLFFDSNAELHAQSRGHELDLDVRGGREKHWNLFKDWLKAIEGRLFERLLDRYIVYGEWLFAAHTVFYNRLPHYFLEFDIYDRQQDRWLDTLGRRRLLEGLPLQSVPVLKPLTGFEGRGPVASRIWTPADGDPGLVFASQEQLVRLIAPSLFKDGQWRDDMQATAQRHGLNNRSIDRIEDSDLAEGLYCKVERDGEVVERFKIVRPAFRQTISDNNEHWLSRPILPNQLAPGLDIFVESA